MRLASPKRPRKGPKRLDLTDLRQLLRDERVHAQLAVVTVPDDTTSHWRKDGGDILVEVVTVPRGIELTCRLGAGAGALGMGLWRVPAVGTEVAVLVPDGEPGFQPTIVACLSSGGAPARAGDDRTVLVALDAIEVQAPKVVMGPDPGSPTEGVVVEPGSVKLGGTSAAEAIPKGTSRNGIEQTMLAALATALTAIGGALTSLGQAGAGGTAGAGATAVTTFASALPGTLSTVSKTL